jgi:D-amino-acid dehydrogenase
MKVLVLGAGIAGVTTAWALARDGHEVTVVDRQALAANETSFSNAGMVAPGHAYTWASPRAPKILLKSLWRDDTALRFKFSTDPRLYAWSWRFLQECNADSAARNTGNKLRLCLFSQAQLQQTVSDTGIEYDRVTGGAVYLYRDPALFEAGVRNTKVLTDLGLNLEAVDPQRAATIEPALDSVKGQLAGAIYSPSDESGDCHGFANKLAALCVAKGRRLQVEHHDPRDRDKRRSHREGRHRQGRADGRRLRARTRLLRADRSAQDRREPADLPGEGLRAHAQGRAAQRRAAALGRRRAEPGAWSRLGDRLRLTATAEFAGYDTSHKPSDFAHMLKVARGLFPGGADYDDPFYWAGLRPMTPKGTPILGQAKHKNLWFNTGLGHMGWTMSHGSAASPPTSSPAASPRSTFAA